MPHTLKPYWVHDANELICTPNVVIGFIPIENEGENENKRSQDEEENYTSVPVFISTLREEYLMNLSIPIENLNEKNKNKGSSTSNDSKWILAGVALFLREDE